MASLIGFAETVNWHDAEFEGQEDTMRFTKISYHHVPGQEHEHPHGHGHGHGHGHHHHHQEEATDQTKDQTIQLLEYLYHHNGEHAEELSGYRDGVDDPVAAGFLDESIELLSKSNEKLGEAIAALKGE